MTNQSSKSKQKFKHFLVLDFEANCENGKKIEPQEIIEFPCLLVDAQSFQVVDTFHKYIKPVGHPQITAFCTELTGITQDMLESCPAWSEVLSQFVTWYQNNNLTPETATFATCGLWDFATCLPGQCSFSGTTIPTMLDVSQSGAFVNVKFSYQKHMGKYGKGITEMQKELGLEFEGKLHSGIDDCRNILKIMQVLAKEGFVFEHNGAR